MTTTTRQPASGRPFTTYASPRPLLLADNAHNATRHGTCDLCPRPIQPGERVTRMLTGDLAHLPCAARAVPPRTGT